MAFPNRQNDLQTVATSNIVLRRIKSVHDPATEIVNELGTTDIAIGDATAEIMITTLGKIPSEMYYLEDTTAGRKVAGYGTESCAMPECTTLAPVEAAKLDEYADRSTLLVILLTTLLVILFMCCVTACIIARSKSRRAFLAKSDVECSPDCGGVSQPLLNKACDTTTGSGSTGN